MISRRKKIRCDGGRPECHNCAKAQETCGYAQSSTDVQLRRAQTRIRTLEERLRTLSVSSAEERSRLQSQLEASTSLGSEEASAGTESHEELFWSQVGVGDDGAVSVYIQHDSRSPSLKTLSLVSMDLLLAFMSRLTQERPTMDSTVASERRRAPGSLMWTLCDQMQNCCGEYGSHWQQQDWNLKTVYLLKWHQLCYRSIGPGNIHFTTAYTSLVCIPASSYLAFTDCE
jgi:hypothetical protein